MTLATLLRRLAHLSSGSFGIYSYALIVFDICVNIIIDVGVIIARRQGLPTGRTNGGLSSVMDQINVLATLIAIVPATAPTIRIMMIRFLLTENNEKMGIK